MEGRWLLETNDARIDVGGVPQLDGLTMRSEGPHVLVLGAARAHFEAAAGTRSPARGVVLVNGEPAALALQGTRVAGAALDTAVPPRWTARAYARWSARLAGHPRDLANRLADEAIERMKMGALADAPLRTAAPHAKRATVLAAALATGAPAIVLEDPCEGLPDGALRSFGHIVAEALADRAWVVFAPRMALSAPLALAADDAIVIEGSQVAAQGAPGELAARERSFALTVHGDVEALAQAAEARGATVRRSRSVLTVDLGKGMTTRDLLTIALEVHAVVVECNPLSRALG